MAEGTIIPQVARPAYTEVAASAAFPGSFQREMGDIFQRVLNLPKTGKLVDWLEFLSALA